MEIFYDNEFAKGIFYPEQRLFAHYWKESTKDFDDNLYKKTAMECIRAVDKSDCKLVLINSHDLRFIIHPTLQQWYVSQIMPVCLKKPIIKIAVVLSEEYIVQLVSEQVADEATAVRAPFATRLFSVDEDAKRWLFL